MRGPCQAWWPSRCGSWHTGRLDGTGLLPSRPVRLPLAGIDPAGVYRHGEQR
ncbi:hypothetical protein [Streptomyces sp. NPDC002619]|uniref:hypothetical protein n=1 Tax=Streptomyces sp. NPDC002619 TaxID=3364655 RepID=UPI00367DA679